MSTDHQDLRARIRDLENTVAGRDSRITELESRLARSRTHRADLTRKNGELQALADRRWVAYQSARERAQAYGEGILRHVEERNRALGWLKAAEGRAAELDQALDTARRQLFSIADAATELTRHDQAHDLYDAGHCTDPDPHPPHTFADDDLRHCTGTATAPTHTNHTP